MDINTILPIFSAALAGISLIMAAKKNNSNDGYFVGRVETKLETIEKKLDEMCKKYERISDEIYQKIDERLEHHIKEYHEHGG